MGAKERRQSQGQKDREDEGEGRERAAMLIDEEEDGDGGESGRERCLPRCESLSCMYGYNMAHGSLGRERAWVGLRTASVPSIVAVNRSLGFPTYGATAARNG